MTDIVPIESIERRIFSLRGGKIMIDRHLAGSLLLASMIVTLTGLQLAA